MLALFGIQTIDFTMSLSSNLKNKVLAGVFAAPNAGTQNGLTAAEVTINSNGNKPILHVLYITPQQLSD